MTKSEMSRTAHTASAGQEQESAVVVDGLHRRFGGPTGFEAVRGVSFTVERGEVFALLGTNGAGKTSTLEVVEGLSKPTKGRVSILGLDPVADRWAVRPRIGIMLQQGGFPSDLTVTETAKMWAGTLSRPRPVDEALEMVDLAQRATVVVKSLSGGERRRLDLALALMNRPDVLFLDEPTTGLDPESRRNTWRLIGDIVAGGAAVVLTTHYLEEAEELADRLAIMHNGRIVTTGTPTDIAADYPSTIAFGLPEGQSASELPVIAGCQVAQSEPKVVLHTDQLQASLSELLSWANARGVSLTALQARTASLEEAFLAVADAGDDRDSSQQATHHVA